jgi:integrase
MSTLDQKTTEFLKHKKPGTYKVYHAGLYAFQEFYCKYGTIPDFLDRLQEDRDSSRTWRENKNVATNMVSDFVLWLGPRYCRKTIRSYVASVQALASYYKLDFSAADARLPPPNIDPQNRKYFWTMPNVQKFVSVLNSPIHECLAMMFIQSGLDCSTTLSLRYSDVRDELESGVEPIVLELERVKTQTPFVTCLGSLGIKYLRRYLTIHGKLSENDLIFPISEQAVDDYFRRHAQSFLGHSISKGKRNPASPHSLRTGFRTLMRRSGCPEEFLEYFMGHDLNGDLRKTYTNMSSDDWRNEYRKYEGAVSFIES